VAREISPPAGQHVHRRQDPAFKGAELERASASSMGSSSCGWCWHWAAALATRWREVRLAYLKEHGQNDWQPGSVLSRWTSSAASLRTGARDRGEVRGPLDVQHDVRRRAGAARGAKGARRPVAALTSDSHRLHEGSPTAFRAPGERKGPPRWPAEGRCVGHADHYRAGPRGAPGDRGPREVSGAGMVGISAAHTGSARHHVLRAGGEPAAGPVHVDRGPGAGVTGPGIWLCAGLATPRPNGVVRGRSARRSARRRWSKCWHQGSGSESPRVRASRFPRGRGPRGDGQGM